MDRVAVREGAKPNFLGPTVHLNFTQYFWHYLGGRQFWGEVEQFWGEVSGSSVLVYAKFRVQSPMSILFMAI